MSDSESNSVYSDNMERDEDSQRAGSYPPGGSRKRSRSGSQLSDSSDREVKRRRSGESVLDYNNLVNKINVLTNVLLQNMILPSSDLNTLSALRNDSSVVVEPQALQERAREPTPGPTSSALDFSLQRPAPAVTTSPVEPRLLNLGLVTTSLKDPKVPGANPEHLKRLETLQKFGNSSWKDVRYTEALKIHNATPGFVDLEINDELRQFVKGKDYTASSEKIMAAICNGLISQRDLLNQNLQEFVNWTALSSTVLSSENIFDKITELFQPASKFHKVSEEIMQMVCGKRAEYIENRRERILSEISNKNLREGLRKIPPSSKHLFDESQLRSYIQSTGGMDKWVRPWFNTVRETQKSDTKSSNKPNRPGQSRDSSNQSFRREGESSTKKNNTFASSSRQTDQNRPKKAFRKDNRFNKKQTDK